MRVRLAHPWRGHSPGDIIDVDDAQGRTLLTGGYATAVEGTTEKQPENDADNYAEYQTG